MVAAFLFLFAATGEKPARGLSHCGDTEASARDVVTTDQPSLSCGKVLNIHMVWERSLLCYSTGFSSP